MSTRDIVPGYSYVDADARGHRLVLGVGQGRVYYSCPGGLRVCNLRTFARWARHKVNLWF